MANEIVVSQSFEEKMKARIKESIGELITDKELSELVHRSVDEIFFKPTKIKDGFNYKEGPSLLNGLIKERLTPQVEKEIKQYINSHPKEVIKAIKEVVTLGIGKALLEALHLQFQNALFDLQHNIENTIVNR